MALLRQILTDPRLTRKRITREHLIATYSANHAEIQVLEAGYLLERIEHDYGIDGLIWTFDKNGGVENGEVKLQLKATDHLKMDRSQAHVLFDVSIRDVAYWRMEPMPVLLLVYDAKQRIAYWVHIQAYWEEFGRNTLLTQQSWRVKIPKSNIFNPEVVEYFRKEKNSVLNRFWTAHG